MLGLVSTLSLANITAAVPMSAATKDMVVAAVNAGMGAASIIAILGGGGLIAYIVKKAFQNGAKKVIIAA